MWERIRAGRGTDFPSRRAALFFNARETATSLLGASDPHSVIFTRNATEGLNVVVRGFLRPGDHVITSSMEHNSVMRPLRSLEAEGIELSVVPCSGTGDIAPDDIDAAIKKIPE